MKTSLTYGAAMAIAGAILNLLLFFAGFHDNADKMKVAQWVGGMGGFAIGVTCLVLAMREKRAQYPADAEWSYGPALGGGVLTGMFASLFGLITGYLYFAVLNPGFSELIYQTQVAAMEAKGLSPAQLEKIEPMLRPWTTPVALTLMQFFMGLVWSVVLSLIVAIFLRKRAIANPVTAEPPVAG